MLNPSLVSSKEWHQVRTAPEMPADKPVRPKPILTRVATDFAACKALPKITARYESEVEAFDCESCSHHYQIRDMWTATECSACHERKEKCGSQTANGAASSIAAQSTSQSSGASTNSEAPSTGKSLSKSPDSLVKASEPTAERPESRGWKRGVGTSKEGDKRGYYEKVVDGVRYRMDTAREGYLHEGLWFADKENCGRLQTDGTFSTNISTAYYAKTFQEIDAKLFPNEGLEEEPLSVGDLVECLHDEAWIADQSTKRAQVGQQLKVIEFRDATDGTKCVGLMPKQNWAWLWPVRSLRLLKKKA